MSTATRVLTALVLISCPIPAAAQAVEPLGDPLARATEGFTHIFDVAELSDGRVLLSDSRERVLAIVDFRAGTVERIGRRGSGPREYQSVFSILPRADGSFGIYDANQRRITVVSPTGQVLGTEAFTPPRLSGFSTPRGPDGQGRWYIDARAVGSNGLLREAILYRWDPQTGGVDSLGVVMQYAPGQGGPGLVPMPAGDAWSVLPDGSVARIAGDDYHVEWWAPDGARTAGPPVPHRRIRVGEREREAWVQELLAQPAAGGVVTRAPRSERPSPADVSARLRQFDRRRFPDFVPPFRWGYAPASPHGHVWVRLDVESGPDRTVFDVIDRNGRLAHRLAVPGRARVVGFGPSSVYLVRLDELDLEWLEKYAYPGLLAPPGR